MLGYVCFKGWGSTGGSRSGSGSSGGRIGGSVGIIRKRRSVAVEVPQKRSHSILHVAFSARCVVRGVLVRGIVRDISAWNLM